MTATARARCACGAYVQGACGSCGGRLRDLGRSLLSRCRRPDRSGDGEQYGGDIVCDCVPCRANRWITAQLARGSITAEQAEAMREAVEFVGGMEL